MHVRLSPLPGVSQQPQRRNQVLREVLLLLLQPGARESVITQHRSGDSLPRTRDQKKGRKQGGWGVAGVWC